ncbi:hypothetical protein WMF37_17930 [Sorangium sp. So ce291]|uniref:hypothetical protein n=1 Tax=Sorangium sp. So ce291 TaxID=3133294 RepID=UPI003F5E82AB
MVESEGNSRSITLEELAAVAGALEAGVPRDEVLAGAGLSVEAWETARERWLARLAAQAARGQLRSSQRYLELVAGQKGRAQAKLREARRKLEGPIPVAPEAHLPALSAAPSEGAPAGAPLEGATPLHAAGASDDRAARSPWARASAVGSPALPLGDRSQQPGATPSPPPAVAPTPMPPPEPPATAPPGLLKRVDRRTAEIPALPEALPVSQGGSSAPAFGTTAAPAAARQDGATRIGAVNALPADGALPFSRTTNVPPGDRALPFARPTNLPRTDSALPFARPTPSSPADKPLPFSRTTNVPPADKALPFSRPTPSPPADNALPFARPTPSPPADSALPFSRPTPSPPADKALPFSRPTPSPPADSALPFSRPTPSPPADKALPFSRPAPPAASSRTVKDETAPLPPLAERWAALPFQQPSSTGGPASNASHSPPAARANAGADAETTRRVERISFAQYARICADMRDHPNHIEQIRTHYGLDPQGWAALHAMWHERFQSSPTLKARWQALVEQSARR